MSRRFVHLVLFVGLTAAGNRATADDKKEPDKLDGKWEVVSETRSGTVAEADGLKDRGVVFKEDKMMNTSQGKERTASRTMKLDATKSPKQIDLTWDGGPLKGKTLPGIYKVEGDTLTICIVGFGKDGKRMDRPTEFASGADSGVTLTTYKRLK